MAKAEWGTKRVCQECGAKFYDMRRAKITRPKCEAVFAAAEPKVKKAPPVAKESTEEKSKAVEPAVAVGASDKDEDLVADDEDMIEDFEDVDVDVDEEDEDEDEDIIEDTSDLGDDEDDVAEVIHKTEAPDDT